MSSEIEKLPRLIERAANALAKATTAGEVLEAKEAAGVAYDAAKIAARLTKFKNAHEEVIAIIRRTQADALVIEARAQCRLADEYDAAQERGEVQKHGGQGKRDIPKENIPSPVADIGLTSKQVHEARQIRDAEKQKPGMVRKMLDKQLEDGEEPTRADVRRAVRETVSPGKSAGRPKGARAKKASPKIDAVQDVVNELVQEGKPVPRNKIAAQFGVGEKAVQMAHMKAKGRMEAEPTIRPEDLSMSAQEKLDMAIRQHKKKLDLEFIPRVMEEVRKRIDEIVLPNWKNQIEQAKTLYARRRALMTKETFNIIRRGLHPDSRGSISDKKLAEAFDAFMKLEKYLLDEADSPTEFGNLPSSLAEWDKNASKAG